MSSENIVGGDNGSSTKMFPIFVGVLRSEGHDPGMHFSRGVVPSLA
jgi:hypothetical protein